MGRQIVLLVSRRLAWPWLVLVRLRVARWFWLGWPSRLARLGLAWRRMARRRVAWWRLAWRRMARCGLARRRLAGCRLAWWLAQITTVFRRSRRNSFVTVQSSSREICDGRGSGEEPRPLFQLG